MEEYGINIGMRISDTESSVRRETLIKYQDKLRLLKGLRNRTIEYYVFMNIPEEDQEEFMKLYHYWIKTDELNEKQIEDYSSTTLFIFNIFDGLTSPVFSSIAWIKLVFLDKCFIVSIDTFFISSIFTISSNLGIILSLSIFNVCKFN